MQRCLAAILFVFLAWSVTCDELKDFVVIVRAKIHEKTKETFNKISERFDKAQEKEIGNIFRNFAKDWHGTGFIVTTNSGENYIVTNRHVVSQSSNVSIEFEKADGSLLPYENCPVIYVDDKFDIAILQFPVNANTSTAGLKIYEKGLKDGDEVCSAGFPGLLGRPGWQFAKGNVTNKMARIPEIIDPSATYLIQHSAPIDPGNSGGPLLITDETERTGYRVVGINSWIINNRNNTYFSLPATLIPAIIEKAKASLAMKNKQADLKAALEKTCKILASELGSDHPDWSRIREYISYDFVAEQGWQSFLSVLEKSSKNDVEKWEQSFFLFSPIETMRSAILNLLWSNLKEKNDLSAISYDSISFADEEKLGADARIRTNFKIGEKKIEIVWAFEYGHWCITQAKLEFSRNANGDTFAGFSPDSKLGDKYSDSRSTTDNKPGIIKFKAILTVGLPTATGSFFDLVGIDTGTLSPSITVAGLLMEFRLHNYFSLECGTFYEKKGVQIYNTNPYTIPGTNPSVTIDYDEWHVYYFQIPVFLNFVLPLASTKYGDEFALKLGAGAGFDYAFLKTGEILLGSFTKDSDAFNHYYEMFNNINISLLFKAGVQFTYQKIGCAINLIVDYHIFFDWAQGYFPLGMNTNFLTISVGPEFILAL